MMPNYGSTGYLAIRLANGQHKTDRRGRIRHYGSRGAANQAAKHHGGKVVEIIPYD